MGDKDEVKSNESLNILNPSQLHHTVCKSRTCVALDLSLNSKAPSRPGRLLLYITSWKYAVRKS